ncbi:hypothetical protein F4778DRAFT_761981 [Xylariomycetidae sp. FL2044]|nr:hypothetical protein F4778DRAFT_761981 [Xylariomycetidae sp. FL2044]
MDLGGGNESLLCCAMLCCLLYSLDICLREQRQGTYHPKSHHHHHYGIAYTHRVGHTYTYTVPTNVFEIRGFSLFNFW